MLRISAIQYILNIFFTIIIQYVIYFMIYPHTVVFLTARYGVNAIIMIIFSMYMYMKLNK